jgi:hypothetical protein
MPTNKVKDMFAGEASDEFLQRDPEKSDAANIRRSSDDESFLPIIIAYSFASLATLIKTVAWWFNQWP